MVLLRFIPGLPEHCYNYHFYTNSSLKWMNSNQRDDISSILFQFSRIPINVSILTLFSFSQTKIKNLVSRSHT